MYNIFSCFLQTCYSSDLDWKCTEYIQKHPALLLHPVIYLNPPLLHPPNLLLLTSAGSVANLRAWVMPTYSLRRARFNTSKCCNASQLTLIIKACASPALPPPHSPLYIQPTRPGVWAGSLTCREQHSISHRSGSMLIVASWEEINKAIKGDITVCLGPPRTHSPPSPSLPPSLSGTYLWGVCWLVEATKRSVLWGFDPGMRRLPWQCVVNGGVGPLTHPKKEKWIF